MLILTIDGVSIGEILKKKEREEKESMYKMKKNFNKRRYIIIIKDLLLNYFSKCINRREKI